MDVNERIIGALKEYGMPVYLNHYSGTERRYIEYDLYDDTGACFCDDEPEFDIVLAQIHVFLPLEEPYLELKKQIRKSLYEAGFSYADITEIVEPEKTSQYPRGIRHLTFEVEILED